MEDKIIHILFTNGLEIKQVDAITSELMELLEDIDIENKKLKKYKERYNLRHLPRA